MKQILFFLLLFYAGTACAQWPAAPNKIRLGNQTTGDGLIYRSDSLPNYTPTSRNNAWFHFDTIAKKLYFHEGGTWQEFTSGGESIYTDSGTVAPIADMLVRTRPDTTFSIAECVGCTGFEDYWDGNGESFLGFFNSSSYWGGAGLQYLNRADTIEVFNEVNKNASFYLSAQRGGGATLRSAAINGKLLTSSAQRKDMGIFLQGRYDNTYSYKMPDENPSFTNGVKSIMTWTGDGAGFAVPAFEAFTGGGTWLKPELEAGDVTINSAGNTLSLNVTNSSSPTFTPAIRVQHDGGTDDVYATGFEMADTTGTNYMRMYHENGSYRIEGGTGVTIQAADTTGVVIMRSGQTDAQIIGGVNGALRVRAGYAEPGRVLLTDYTQSQGVSVASPDTVSAAWTLTLPPAAPSNGQVLTAVGTTGVTTWATPATGGVTGTGTTGTIPVWSGATALGDSPLTVSSGDVTATGTGAFSVPVGTTAQQPGSPTAGMTRYNSTNGALEYRGASAWEVPLKSTTATGLGTAGRVFYADANGRSAADDILYWDATNNRLGVGVSPSFPLDVQMGSNRRIFFTNGGAGNAPAMTIATLTGTGKSVALATGLAGSVFITDNTGNFYITRETKAAIDAGTSNGGTVSVTVTNTPAMGINNADPLRTLHVTGEVRITDLTTDPPTRIVGADADGDLGQITIGNGLALASSVASFNRGAPVTKTGDFTVATTENWLIVNNASANTTVTLPTASTNTGRELMLKNLSGTYTVISNASNVVPLAGGAAGTAILPATAGAWCTLVSDGTNWIIMQQ